METVDNKLFETCIHVMFPNTAEVANVIFMFKMKKAQYSHNADSYHKKNKHNIYVCLQVRETSQIKHLDTTGESKKELIRLQEDKEHLKQQVEVGLNKEF